MVVADGRLLAREAVLSAAVAGSLAAVLLWAMPPGIDWAAHAYQRTFLLQHGFAIWNNFWYAGRYSFVNYSLAYYPLAALVGIKVLALASIVCAAAAFTFVVFGQWGSVSRHSSRTFAVIWAGFVGSAAFPFTLAVAFALLAVWEFQRGRRARFAIAAVLTFAASPLAFALLVLVLAGAAFSRTGGRRGLGVPLAVIAACGVTQLLLLRLFGDGGRYPFGMLQLLPALGFSGVGLIVTRRVPGARSLHGLFLVYLVAVVAAYFVPSTVGSNIERIRYLALPLALIAVALRNWRPRWLVVPVVVLAAVWNVTPIALNLAHAQASAESSASYWQPAIGFLHRSLSPSFRVEVVDTAGHWSATYLPEAGIPIVRGWYRQNDFPQNELLYDGHLGALSYEAWLRRLGVRYVVLSDAGTDYSSRAEAELIRSGRTDLVPVFRSAHLVVYALPRARPLITGPGGATVLWLWPSRLVSVVAAAGTYRVGLRWSPYWHTSQGCVSRAGDGMVRLTTRHAGLVELRVALDVHGSLEAFAGRRGPRCAS